MDPLDERCRHCGRNLVGKASHSSVRSSAASSVSSGPATGNAFTSRNNSCVPLPFSSVVIACSVDHWLIMKNGDHVIGLFQGMFDKNILTFNPGWNSDAQPLKEFTDVRELQRQLKASGITMITEADENSTGPASFMIADPDGNTILVDQHV